MKNGQVSVEYLLILAAFFSVLALMLPLVSNSVDQLFFANDIILSKKIINTIENEDEKFLFLADGSNKSYEFIPSKSIFIKIKNNNLKISSGEKEFELELNNSQSDFEKEFNEKLFINIKKENNKTIFEFS